METVGWVLALLSICAGLYLLSRVSVDYSQLDDPNYLDERTEYEARIRPPE